MNETNGPPLFILLRRIVYIYILAEKQRETFQDELNVADCAILSCDSYPEHSAQTVYDFIARSSLAMNTL